MCPYVCVSVNNNRKMSYYAVRDPEALVSCPYDRTHMIRNKRMQYHLIDCRKVRNLMASFVA